MKSLKLVVSYARPFIWPLVATVVAMLGLVGVQLLAPWTVRTLVASVTGGQWGPETNALVTRLALTLLAIYAARAVLSFLRSYLAHIAGWGVVADARRDIYRHLQRMSSRFYEDKQTGELMSRMVNDSDKFETLISHAIPDTLTSVFMLAGVIAVLVSMNWRLMLLTIIPVPLVLFAMQGFSRFVRPAFRTRQVELAELNASINDNLSGIREIKAFVRETRRSTSSWRSRTWWPIFCIWSCSISRCAFWAACGRTFKRRSRAPSGWASCWTSRQTSLTTRAPWICGCPYRAISVFEM